MRLLASALLAALSLLLVPAATAADPAETQTSAVGEICTYDLIEAVAVCVAKGCVTVYTGPSSQTVCLDRAIGLDPSHFSYCTPLVTYQAYACASRDNTWYCYEAWIGMMVAQDCFQFIGP